MNRPENHVTREIAQRLASKPLPPLPEIPEALLKRLEADHPPRCLEPRETVEDHLRYAGKVELIAALRLSFEERREVALDGQDLEPDIEDLLRSGERAS